MYIEDSNYPIALPLIKTECPNTMKINIKLMKKNNFQSWILNWGKLLLTIKGKNRLLDTYIPWKM